MAIKKYTSYSHISVVLGKLRISFHPLTGGGSYFTTENETLQKLLEKHYEYGKLFKCTGIIQTPTNVVKQEPVEATEELSSKDKYTEVVVACLEDAKEYLAEHIGTSRVRMRSEKAIKEIASQNKIKFVGI